MAKRVPARPAHCMSEALFRSMHEDKKSMIAS